MQDRVGYLLLFRSIDPLLMGHDPSLILTIHDPGVGLVSCPNSTPAANASLRTRTEPMKRTRPPAALIGNTLPNKRDHSVTIRKTPTRRHTEFDREFEFLIPMRIHLPRNRRKHVKELRNGVMLYRERRVISVRLIQKLLVH